MKLVTITRSELVRVCLDELRNWPGCDGVQEVAICKSQRHVHGSRRRLWSLRHETCRPGNSLPSTRETASSPVTCRVNAMIERSRCGLQAARHGHAVLVVPPQDSGGPGNDACRCTHVGELHALQKLLPHYLEDGLTSDRAPAAPIAAIDVDQSSLSQSLVRRCPARTIVLFRVNGPPISVQ